MATNKKVSGKKAVFRISPLLLTVCTVAALLIGLIVGLLIPTPGSHIPSTPLSAVKVEDLSVNTVMPEDPVTLKFKLNGLPEDTQLTLLVKCGSNPRYLDCPLGGDYFTGSIGNITEEPTHITLVLVHEGASMYLPLIRNLSRADSSVGYLGVWDYQ